MVELIWTSNMSPDELGEYMGGALNWWKSLSISQKAEVFMTHTCGGLKTGKEMYHCLDCDKLISPSNIGYHSADHSYKKVVVLDLKVKEKVVFTEIPVEDVPKTKGATYRGIGKNKHAGVRFYGKGLYSTTDIVTAKEYGHVIGILGGMPEKPLIIDGKKECLDDWCRRESGILSIRDFNKKFPDVSEFIKSRGYDGVIDGVIVVRYT